MGCCAQLTLLDQVQLQTLTAIVKLFLKKPDESQAIVQKVLQAATKDCDSADVRDRAYIYWRLLSSDPAAAKVSRLNPPVYNVVRAKRSC
jgi:vesicle coat complex subunit